ncbi:hypothetical protein [Hazenella coriacea]|uniref:Uncharacterized protein n=1 Tax=Hazenella coriacea TaxID=1179467 RepID=A0A4R3LBT3_9BACL|nr:hypothetical protein [Hazenella coriacea]TCS94976.1 hypothetical protein EDD58_103401 [Hazenella coriacea]
MFVVDFSTDNVLVKQDKAQIFKASELIEQLPITEIDLLEMGTKLVPELKKAREKGLPIVVGIPRDGNILSFIGIIQVIYGIMGSFPFVVTANKGVYDLDQALDLYEIMDSARLMRI